MEVSSSLLASQMAAESIGVAIIDVVSAHPHVKNAALRLLPIRPARWWRLGLFTLKAKSPGPMSDLFRKSVISVANAIQETPGALPLLSNIHKA